MQKFVNVRSTAEEVKPLEIDEYHVFKNVGITQISEPSNEETGEQGFTGFEIAEQYMYEKDEYIALISTENESLQARTTEVEGTLDGILTDVIPSLMGS
jgi:hypothetical protein